MASEGGRGRHWLEKRHTGDARLNLRHNVRNKGERVAAASTTVFFLAMRHAGYYKRNDAVRALKLGRLATSDACVMMRYAYRPGQGGTRPPHKNGMLPRASMNTGCF